MTFPAPTGSAQPRRERFIAPDFAAAQGIEEPTVNPMVTGFAPEDTEFELNDFARSHSEQQAYEQQFVQAYTGATGPGGPQAPEARPARARGSRSGNPYFSSGNFQRHLQQEERDPKDVMTYASVTQHSLLLLAVVVASAALTWALFPLLGAVAGIFGMILAWVNISRRKVSPALVIAYGVFEGAFLGFLSWAVSAAVGHNLSADPTIANSIVFQALLGTFITFAVVLMLFRSGRLQANGKFKMILLAAFVGFILLQLVSIPLMMTGLLFGGWHFVLGIETLITLAAICLAAFSLVIDFSMIQHGVNEGWPLEYSWRAAFGLTLTLVWIYVEFLRLLAIFARRR
jgi:uncharacterized YccA/Bax inhibitor family protein